MQKKLQVPFQQEMPAYKHGSSECENRKVLSGGEHCDALIHWKNKRDQYSITPWGQASLWLSLECR
jgi:hypothetical protein